MTSVYSMQHTSTRRSSNPVTFPDHLRPYVFERPGFSGKSGEEAGRDPSFLLTLFQGRDGHGWAFVLRPPAQAGSPADAEPSTGRRSRRPTQHWGLTVDTGRVVGVRPEAGEDRSSRGEPRTLVPLPPPR